MEPVDVAGHPQQVAVTADALFAAGAPPEHIARVIAGINDELIRALLQSAENVLGPPPCPYAWLALGSAGRMEQVLPTDQDHAIAYAADDAFAHAYFRSLAELMVEGLLRAGFPRCPGGYMATNWRHSLAVWKHTFHAWVAEPTPQALVEAEVFLDFRRIGGDLTIDALDQILLGGGAGGGFLFHLAQVARRFPPPLGWFGRIKATDGAVDLKRGGLSAIVLLARLYALAAGSTARATLDRLAAAEEEGVLSQWGAESLADSFRLLMRLRLAGQLRRLDEGRQPDNTVLLADLSPPDRKALRDALRMVRKVQDSTVLRFGIW